MIRDEQINYKVQKIFANASLFSQEKFLQLVPLWRSNVIFYQAAVGKLWQFAWWKIFYLNIEKNYLSFSHHSVSFTVFSWGSAASRAAGASL